MSVKTVKCECGHINHEGTVLCEACVSQLKATNTLMGTTIKKFLKCVMTAVPAAQKPTNEHLSIKRGHSFHPLKSAYG